MCMYVLHLCQRFCFYSSFSAASSASSPFSTTALSSPSSSSSSDVPSSVFCTVVFAVTSASSSSSCACGFNGQTIAIELPPYATTYIFILPASFLRRFPKVDLLSASSRTRDDVCRVEIGEFVCGACPSCILAFDASDRSTRPK